MTNIYIWAFTLLNISIVPSSSKEQEHTICKNTIDVELVDYKPFEAYCGDVIFSYMYKYKIINNNSSKLSDIYVVHVCIEFLDKDFFKIGQRYRVSLERIKNAEKYLESNKHTDAFISVKYSGGKIYNCKKIEKIK